jgi:O-acetyl-ADP-ribose deacetylase (regulator of RNase III)
LLDDRAVSPLRFLKGAATEPDATGRRIVAHVCNDAGGWGKGFVLAISRRWSEPERAYREWYSRRAKNDFALGAVQLVTVLPDTWVANMVGQHGYRRVGDVPPIRYDAVETCLKALAERALELGASVHMPRIGCGLAGGTWDRIEPIILRTLSARDVSVTVYDFMATPAG